MREFDGSGHLKKQGLQGPVLNGADDLSPLLQKSLRLDLAREIQVLRNDLQKQFQNDRWEEFLSTLRVVVKLAENHGQREVCLRAQGLLELLGYRAGGRAGHGGGLQRLFDELLFHLSHFQWSCQSFEGHEE